MAYFDLYLDPDTNDIVYEDGKFTACPSYKMLARQRLYIRLNTFMGEWFINTDFGVPYKQSVMVKNITKEEVDAIFISQINTEELVNSITAFESTFSKSTRTYSGSFTVEVSSEDLDNPLEDTVNDEWTYSASDSTLSGSVCDGTYTDTEYITYANSIYYTVNFEIPLGGVKGWANTWS